MQTRTKLLLAAMTAGVFMSFAVSAAQARRIWVSNTRYQAIFTLLSLEIEGIGTIGCPITVEGSFHSASVSKVSGLLAGYVTSAKVRGGSPECLNTGTLRVNTETLPWHIRYDSFAGTLPTIERIRLQLIGSVFEVDPAGSTPKCRARTTAANPGVADVVLTEGTGGNRIAKEDRVNEAARIPVGGEFFCEISGTTSNFHGTGEVFLQGSTSTRVLVRLIQ